MMHDAVKSFPEFFDTLLIQPDSSSFSKTELKEYYSDLLLPEICVSAEIISSKTLEEVTGKFTVYIIEVDLGFAKYHIEKRYSLFFDLYKKIDQNYKNIGLETTNFPSRWVFCPFTLETIEHRKFHLNNFLQFLCQVFKDEGIVEFLEFLEVKKRLAMMRRMSNFDSFPRVSRHSSKHSKYDAQALEFLTLFNKKPKNLCKSFKEFEHYFMDQRPRLSKLCIQKLFYGDGELKGLLQLCGKVDINTDSHLACGSGLHLIVKLLDYECNKDAEIYNQAFGSASFRDIMCLYFEHHIQGKVLRSCKLSALKLLYIFLNHNPSLSAWQMLSSDEAIREFETWKLSQQTTSIKAENYLRCS